MSHTLRIALVDVVTRLFLSAYSSRRTTRRRVRRALSRRSSCERCGIMRGSLPPVVPNTALAHAVDSDSNYVMVQSGVSTQECLRTPDAGPV